MAPQPTPILELLGVMKVSSKHWGRHNTFRLAWGGPLPGYTMLCSSGRNMVKKNNFIPLNSVFFIFLTLEIWKKWEIVFCSVKNRNNSYFEMNWKWIRKWRFLIYSLDREWIGQHSNFKNTNCMQ